MQGVTIEYYKGFTVALEINDVTDKKQMCDSVLTWKKCC